jgi:hypothetical protein
MLFSCVLMVCSNGERVGGLPRAGSKDFFFEKKKQKTFIY